MQIKFAICLEKILKVLGKYSQSSFTSYGIITGPSAEEEPITDRNRTKFEGRASLYICCKNIRQIYLLLPPICMKCHVRAEDTLTLKRLSTHHNRPSDTVEIPSRYRRDTVGMLLAIYERLTREIREAIEAHRECPVDKE